MSLFSNPGKVDVDKAAESIVENGGGMSSSNKGDHIHHTAYSRDEDRHLSWDEYPDGSVKNVHTDKNGRSYTQYGNK
ncbi:hypothetical protein IJS18_00400 [Candidatus Saccharibacteria bacterium]|nr:hypothetical protein [Candidatus Saccharibacteria bacterium]